MDLERGAVQREKLHFHAENPFLLHEGEDALEHAALRPALRPLVNAVPFAVGRGHGAPLATVLRDEQYRAKESEVVDLHVAALDGQEGRNEVEMFLGQFHES